MVFVVECKGTDQAERSSILRFFNSFRLYPFQINIAGRQTCCAKCARSLFSTYTILEVSGRSFSVPLAVVSFSFHVKFFSVFFFSIRVKRADAWASVIIMLQIVFDIRESTDGCAQRAHIAHITTFGYYVVVDGLPFFCFSFSPFQFVIRCIRTRRGHITYERTHTHGLGKDDECD